MICRKGRKLVNFVMALQEFILDYIKVTYLRSVGTQGNQRLTHKTVPFYNKKEYSSILTNLQC